MPAPIRSGKENMEDNKFTNNSDKDNGNNPHKWRDNLIKIILALGFASFFFMAIMRRYGGW
jgi:hypothetical protein